MLLPFQEQLHFLFGICHRAPPPPPSSLLSYFWFQAKEEPLPLISLQPVITRCLGAALDVGHVLPFPTWFPPTRLSSRGALPTVPTLVLCAFLLSSPYTTYTHCGLGGAHVKHVQWWLPTSFSVTVNVHPKATSLGVFLRGKGLLPKLTLPHYVVECAVLYLLNKACSLLKPVSLRSSSVRLKRMQP